RWVSADWKRIEKSGTDQRHAERFYGIVRDFFKAAEKVWKDVWGDPAYFVTTSVTIKAMLRVCQDLADVDSNPADGRGERWTRRLSPWSELAREFRAEGFYERFPAKGQVERVARIEKDLARAAKIEPLSRGRGKK